MLVYIHIPFCKKKCVYCDFCSVEGTPNERYLAALKREIELASGDFSEVVESVYFGGGTPSVLDAGVLPDILNTLSKYCKLGKSPEVTAEANPENIDIEKLHAWKAGGINRVSIGVQSLNDKTLAEIGRLHNAEEALDAVKNAVKIIGNVSADLMAGLPHQTPENARNDTLTLINEGINHLSCYMLHLDDGVLLKKKIEDSEIVLPSEDASADIFDAVKEALIKSGFNRYEVSNFARTGYRSRHNLGYWTGENYLGLGLSAHSYLNGVRFENPSEFAGYYSLIESGKLARKNHKKLSEAEKLSEYIMLRLRLSLGIDLAEFYRRFGFDFLPRYSSVIEKYSECFVIDESSAALNDRGFDIMNMILCELI
jgi:oxygen-independent coproporphyrinogen-3 oxidase